MPAPLLLVVVWQVLLNACAKIVPEIAFAPVKNFVTCGFAVLEVISGTIFLLTAVLSGGFFTLVTELLMFEIGVVQQLIDVDVEGCSKFVKPSQGDIGLQPTFKL